LRQIHALPEFPGRFWVPQIFADYSAIARRYGVDFPENFPWLAGRLKEAEAALTARPIDWRPCHNDLLNENFLFDGRLRILDWEYAGMGDPFFDLANFSVNHDFADEHDRLLLAWYFESPTPVDWARLKVTRIISDFREAMWGLVQTGISTLDFDFPGYAQKHFNRLTINLQHPGWDTWIKEISAYA
jgi:thiamine kinase-like enzyme